MRAALSHIDQPILFATSRGISLAYRRFGISPIRQVPGWEMTVALIELTVVLLVMAILHRIGDRSLVYILPLMAFSMIVEVFTNGLKFRRIPNVYDAKAYRQACAEAEENRSGGLYLRSFSLVLPISALVMFTSVLPPSHVWIAWCGMLYFSLYASKFFVRACEPPHPDEGDFFAVPSAS
ncbi:hypothetical protein D3C71_316030 [compost metagenome]